MNSGMEWKLALALVQDGWRLIQDIIWAKPSPMPESVKSRCTKSHEYVFLMSKSKDYYIDMKSIQEESSWDTAKPFSLKYTTDTATMGNGSGN